VVIRVGFFATIRRKPRQARKGAAVADEAGVEEVLARIASPNNAGAGMSYLVLARKWRPRRFEELVGQEHVVRALSNGLESGRVHHAFLFTGTRGVGKTTVARLLAKALNCDQGVSSHPCGECGTCKEIEEGRFVDLIEVDAASRTKVEDTRELLENVQYAPTRGRYKVYLIDEVHMLSGHSFNALLKTLEEPPPHVKFLLATTDPQKLPITVVSRCLQFHLKRLMPSLIVSRLSHILEIEKIPFDAAALELLAHAADGSLRDALSLLDQALVYGAGSVIDTDVRQMLGTIDRAHVLKLMQALAAADAEALLAVMAEMEPMGLDYHQVLGECSEAVLRLTREQWVAGTGFGDYSEAQPWVAIAAAVSAEELQLWFQIMLIGRRDLSLALSAKSGFEMTMLRCLAFKPDDGDEHAGHPGARALGASRGKPSAKAPLAGGVQNLHASNDANVPKPPATVTPLRARSNALAKDEPAPMMPEAWRDPAAFPEWVHSLPLRGAVAALLSHCSLIEATPERLRLRLDSKGFSFYSTERVEHIEALIFKLTRLAVGVQIERQSDVAREAPAQPTSAVAQLKAASTLAERQTELHRQTQSKAQQQFLSDPVVKALREHFHADVKLDSVKPIDKGHS